MAIFAATEYVITVGGTDLSDHITAVDMPIEVAELDSTNFGSAGWNARTGGLKDSSVTIGFQQDFAAAEVDATIWPLLGTAVTVVVKPRNEAVSATNPSYSGSFLASKFTPIAGKVGDLAVMSVQWPLAAGPVTRTV